MLLFGLTGGIASGKSTVAQHFVQLGCPVIDADRIARDVVKPGRPAWRKIVSAFGEDVLESSGEINRAALGAIIFNDTRKRSILNQCTHPYIQRTMLKQALWYFLRGEKFVVLDIPLLFESGRLVPWMKKIMVVYCSEEQQMVRLIQRNNLTQNEARKRISAQIPLQEKIKMADFIVDNSQSLEETKKQVEQVYHHLKATAWWCGLHRWIIVFVCLFISICILYFRN